MNLQKYQDHVEKKTVDIRNDYHNLDRTNGQFNYPNDKFNTKPNSVG
jgi:hypothetical protein